MWFDILQLFYTKLSDILMQTRRFGSDIAAQRGPYANHKLDIIYRRA